MSRDYQTTVTLNKRFCHPQCYQVQLNGYMRDDLNTTQLWKSGKGGPANPVSGECGKVNQWGFCTRAQSQGNPPPPTNIVSTATSISPP